AAARRAGSGGGSARDRQRAAMSRGKGSDDSGGDRCIYGVGPVRELIARRASGVRAIWVDPRRADKSAGDPVAQLVTAARAAGVRVEDRDRAALDRAAGEDARHQGELAWVGAFVYAE